MKATVSVEELDRLITALEEMQGAILRAGVFISEANRHMIQASAALARIFGADIPSAPIECRCEEECNCIQ